MIEPTLHFSADEYQTRIGKTRNAMEKAGVDLIIVSDPSNMAWLTGYDGWSFYVHQRCFWEWTAIRSGSDAGRMPKVPIERALCIPTISSAIRTITFSRPNAIHGFPVGPDRGPGMVLGADWR